MIPQFKASQIIFQSLSRWYLITLRETGLSNRHIWVMLLIFYRNGILKYFCAMTGNIKLHSN